MPSLLPTFSATETASISTRRVEKTLNNTAHKGDFTAAMQFTSISHFIAYCFWSSWGFGKP